MKWLLILLFIPFSPFCQTVHLDEDKIVYKGSVKTSASFNEVQEAVEKAIGQTKSKIISWQIDSSTNEITVNAEMKLKSDRTMLNSMRYMVKSTLKEGDYHYKIDSVYVLNKEIGYRTTTITSKELIKKLDDTGPIASEAEKQLNEIDMRFEQLTELLKNYLKK
jgi:hypothetical protein